MTLSWETERDFMGAFKANLPGHYRYQERLFSHFVQNDLEPRHRGIFLAGDDVSWTAGWAEGAIQTAINAVWGVVNHLAALRLPRIPDPATCSRSLLRSGWATELTATAEMSCPMGVGTPIGHDLFPVIHATLESVRIQ